MCFCCWISMFKIIMILNCPIYNEMAIEHEKSHHIHKGWGKIPSLISVRHCEGRGGRRRVGLGSKGAGGWEVPVTTLRSRKDGVVQRAARIYCQNLLFAKSLYRSGAVCVLYSLPNPPLGTEYQTENPFCCGLRTSGKQEVCLKRDEDNHGPLEHQRISRLSDGPFWSPRRSACKQRPPLARYSI